MRQEQKVDIIRILFSIVLMIVGYGYGTSWCFFTAYLLCGYEVLFKGGFNLLKGHALDENFLMMVATLGAIYCGDYPEAAGVMIFFSIGEFFEESAVDKSRKSIAEAMDLKVPLANKIVDSQLIPTDPEILEINDVILIKPGERVPIDGIVISGNSSLDTSTLTGESLPVDISPGDGVISGAVNGGGAIEMRVTADYEDSALGKILDLVENAAANKAQVEKFITKFAKYYTPIVVGLAVLLAVVPSLFIEDALFKDWLYRAMVFLVISCPCALVISIPMSLFAGIGAASSKGILIKGSNYFEALSSLNAIAFDKTGTLTTGKFHVSHIVTAPGVSEKTLLEKILLGEALSDHPVAKAIVKHIKNLSQEKDLIAPITSSNYEELPGYGVSVVQGDYKIYCGNQRLMEKIGAAPMEVRELGSFVHVAEEFLGERETEYLGYLVVSDTIRPEALETIQALKCLGINERVMFTGDRKDIAQRVAEKIGITSFKAELLPQDKVAALTEVMDRIKREDAGKDSYLAFVGDGINDAPVLARSDVGIAMGAFGSDAAIEAADVVILADDIMKIPQIIRISRRTLRICKENVIFALGIKFGVLILGALGMASMWAAVFADVGVAMLAILNAMRALKVNRN